MRLWNDYEGTTIAEIYPIEKLLRPEGRSALFSTSNGTGVPAVIRLIESINDEGEILNRWQTVADLQETHLITLKKFGQTVFEGTPLIYVLMESTEADLAGILKERPLTMDETHQIAASLVGALQALHASGIVHEHIEPSNVLATGDLVKLRSDCVREAPEGEEGVALKKRDVHDLAVVLLQAMTQRRTLDTAGKMPLPHPYEQIIRNGISGTWGLAQIASALKPVVPRAALVPATPAAPPTAAAPTAPTDAKVQAEQSPQATPAAAPSAAAPRPQASVPAERATPVSSTRIFTAPPPAAVSTPENPSLSHRRINASADEEPKRMRLGMAMVPVILVLLAALGWYFYHRPETLRRTAGAPGSSIGSEASSTGASSPNADAGAATGTAASSASPAMHPEPAPAVPSARPDTARHQMASAGDADHRWHVVAFTYNHQDQAQHKADQLAKTHATLRPEVFSPSGRSPYLVSLGGPMTRNEAIALRAKARGAGMPRDTFARNYKNAR